MKMKERLYLTEDRSKAVAEDDRRGRHLLCKKGSELDDKEAAKYGLVDGGLAPEPVEQIIPPEVKRSPKSKKGGSKKGGLVINKLDGGAGK